tara:strand:+ start:79 stop:606 length:528 start_codon:yes stop_codon:yes gene_type:complete
MTTTHNLVHETSAIAWLTSDNGTSAAIFENPRVRESRATGYARTKIYRRQEPIRLWVGSEAKKYDIEWRWVVPHLEALFPDTWRVKLMGWMDCIINNAAGSPPAELHFSGCGISTGSCLLTNYEFEQNFDNGAGGAWGEKKELENGDMGYEYNEQNAFSRIITVRISLESQYHDV